MTKRRGWIPGSFIFIVVLALLSAASSAQDCLSPPSINASSERNIFSAQQEVELGNAQAESIKQSLNVIQDSELTSYAQKILDRLEQTLPPNRFQFRLTIIEAGNADAFSIAGGRIYLSRKLLASLRNEDELAGIIAHEMGHTLAHHEAIRMTESLQRTLGITQLDEKQDVVALWNRYLDNYRRQHLAVSDYLKAWKLEQQEQAQADAVALYILARAGYSPQAYAKAFDRVAGTKGNTGNFWSDLFGTTPTDAKRLRQLLNTTPALPKSCILNHEPSDAEFRTWQKSVIDYTSKKAQESLPGLVSRLELTDRLRPEIQHIRVSPDAKYVLAQDENAIYVLTREPFRSVFMVEASGVRDVQFTADSHGFIFYSSAGYGGSPRIERWDIASQRRTVVREVFLREGCPWGTLSREGRVLVCSAERWDLQTLFGLPALAQRSIPLIFLDTESGAEIFRKDGFDFPLIMSSPDGHYLVVHTPQRNLVFDCSQRKELHIPLKLQPLLESGRFTFLADGTFLAATDTASGMAELVDFPSGRSLTKDIPIGGARTISELTEPGYVLLKPVKNDPLGILDLKQRRVVFGSKRQTLELSHGQVIAERRNGDLQVFDLSTAKGGAEVSLPPTSISYVHVAIASPDLSHFAASTYSSAAVWDLKTGKRLYHTRRFDGAYFAGDSALYVDFPKYMETEREIVKMPLKTASFDPVRQLDEKKTPRTILIGPYLLTQTSASDHAGDTRIELLSVTDQKSLWSKDLLPGAQIFPSADASSMTVSWFPDSKGFKTLAREDAEFTQKLKPFNSDDQVALLESFELSTGKPKAKMAVDTGKGSLMMGTPAVVGDNLIFAAGNSRYLVYSLLGQERGAIAGVGGPAHFSASAQLLVVRTSRNELEVYDLKTVQRRFDYRFASPVVASVFSEDGTRLLAFTSDQVVYILDLKQADKSEPGAPLIPSVGMSGIQTTSSVSSLREFFSSPQGRCYDPAPVCWPPGHPG